MQTETSFFPAADGTPRHVIDWRPDPGTPIRAALHIAHGMAEYSARYARLAEALTAAGFAVSAADHRGHGRTTEEGPERGIFAESDGWRLATDDVRDMVRRLRAQYANVPLVVMGHSMGSLLVQQILTDNDEVARMLSGAVLSATSGKPPFIASVGRLVARFERWRLGPRGRSPIIHALTFQDFNKHFKPARTEFDWLSREASSVDAYVADPDCGYPCSVQLWIDVLDSVAHITSDAAQSNIRTDLPIYLFSGERDPVGDMSRSVRSLERDLQRVGVTNLTCTIYPEARHETLNETNREEVVRNLLEWLEARVPA
ncbi:MAG TPA: alpha/beta hydrolase [Deltaproteobacteria bacterium]|nr:alpha/beta hydrolase [Deltaproteobacteria bacterium]